MANIKHISIPDTISVQYKTPNPVVIPVVLKLSITLLKSCN